MTRCGLTQSTFQTRLQARSLSQVSCEHHEADTPMHWIVHTLYSQANATSSLCARPDSVAIELVLGVNSRAGLCCAALVLRPSTSSIAAESCPACSEAGCYSCGIWCAACVAWPADVCETGSSCSRTIARPRQQGWTALCSLVVKTEQQSTCSCVLLIRPLARLHSQISSCLLQEVMRDRTQLQLYCRSASTAWLDCAVQPCCRDGATVHL